MNYESPELGDSRVPGSIDQIARGADAASTCSRDALPAGEGNDLEMNVFSVFFKINVGSSGGARDAVAMRTRV